MYDLRGVAVPAVLVSSCSALHRLEKRGWLEAEWGASEKGRQAKFYKLSSKGKRQLESEQSNWNRLSGAVANILQTEPAQ